jgi:hypothetical protein
MYRPEGKVMPAYSTWQPTEGKIQPVASAVQSATRRLVDPRGELMRGNPIASTLLGVFDGPSDPFREGGNTAVGSYSCSRPPEAAGQAHLTLLHASATRQFRLPGSGRARIAGMDLAVRSSGYLLG